MSKTKKLLKEIEENGGAVFKGDYMYSKSHCDTCKEDFVLVEHDDPGRDDHRVLSFPDVCDDCL